MIRISFTPPNELDISGTPDELQEIRAAILKVATEAPTNLEVAADQVFDPRPYERRLYFFRIYLEPGPVRVSVEDDAVHVVGSETSLEAFASFFNFSDNDPPGSHFHHEYYDGNEWIHDKSIPLVVGARGTG